MVPEIEKILYATDLSQNAAYAFSYADYLAEKLDAKIIILHVVEKMSPDAQITLQTYLDAEDHKKLLAERANHAIERIKKTLKTFCEKELQGDQQIEDRIESIKVCKGYPAEEILKKTVALNCDAIVMGAHEKGSTHTFLGSVAKSVLRRSRHPTFVVPLPRGEIDLSVHD
ncbi:MAG: universal stress protein [Desulfosarcina sp.]|nr:universal stress protein [Desulfosarcina sp.]MBC2744406.1 universal stress protein [Desulfosarcina sp.]MBC2767314.1 universal stress protein [Desulfosarcina sp.]